MGPRVMLSQGDDDPVRHCMDIDESPGYRGLAEESVCLLQEETNSFLKAIEEANKKMEAAELSLEEKDQRIGELDRLIERMEKVTDTAWACFPRCPVPLCLLPPLPSPPGPAAPAAQFPWPHSSFKTYLESEASVLTPLSPQFSVQYSLINTEGS